MQEMAEAEAADDGDIDLRRHQRAPGEGPALLHAADQEGQRGRQDHPRPAVKALGAHGPGGAGVDRRDGAGAGVGGDDHGPHGPHDDDEQHRHLGLAEPEQRQRNPAHARQGLQPERHDADRVLEKLRRAHEEAERQSEDDADHVAGEQAAQGDPGGVDERPVAERRPQIIRHRIRRRQQYRRPAAAHHRQLPDPDQRQEKGRGPAGAHHSATSMLM